MRVRPTAPCGTTPIAFAVAATVIGMLSACNGQVLPNLFGNGANRASASDDADTVIDFKRPPCAPGEFPNGQDDNENGHVDEGCTCKPGTMQRCWPGKPNERGKGICKDGVQTCGVVNEAVGWGDCQGAAPAQDEVLNNDVDEDCDGKADGDTPRYCTHSEYGEECNNGVDEDCDGLEGCTLADGGDAEDCVSTRACGGDGTTYEVCVNSEVDADGDGAAGCLDTECQDSDECDSSVCVPDESGQVDCSLRACMWTEKCGVISGCHKDEGVSREICGDKRDNDGDCLPDCWDDQCQNEAACKPIVPPKKPKPKPKPPITKPAVPPKTETEKRCAEIETIQSRCFYKLDLIFVIDGSGSMDFWDYERSIRQSYPNLQADNPNKMDKLKTSVRDVLVQLSKDGGVGKYDTRAGYGDHNVGVVVFGGGSKSFSPPSNTRESILAYVAQQPSSFWGSARDVITLDQRLSVNSVFNTIKSLQPDGGTPLLEGLATAHAQMARSTRREPNVKRVFVVISDGKPYEIPWIQMDATGKRVTSVEFLQGKTVNLAGSPAREFRDIADEVYAFSLGTDQNASTMRALTKGPAGYTYFYSIRDPGELTGRLRDLVYRACTVDVCK